MAQETSLFEKFKETGKHGIIYGLGTSFQYALSIILVPIYTRELTTADYGVLGLVMTTGSIFLGIFGLGITSGLIRSYYDYENENERKTVVSTAVILTAASCILLGLLGLLVSRQLSIMLFQDEGYRPHLLIIMGSTIFGLLTSIPYILFRAKMKSTLFSILNLVFFVVGLGLTIYMVAVLKWGILGALYGNFITGALSFFGLYYYIRGDISLKFSMQEARKMLSFGVPLVPTNLGGFVMNFSARYFLNAFTSLGAVGLFTLGYQFGSVFSAIFIMPLRQIWTPMFLSVKDHSNAKEFYGRALTYVLFIGCFLFLGLSLLSKEVIRVLATKQYWDSYIIVPLIVGSFLLYSFEIILNVGIGLKRKTKLVMVYFVAGGLVNLGFNFLLIPRYGMLGAAYATLISYIAMMVIVYLFNRRLIKVDYEWARIAKIGLVTALIFAAGYLVRIDNLYASAGFKLAVILAYPFLLYLSRFYLPEEKQKTRELTRKLLDYINLRLTGDKLSRRNQPQKVSKP
ncbi:MAG: oligosaccharide flippase family protein [Chloroflexi bacterium]|nr:oligosaccharide flippase family protein [Chloroflexota bacterium]